MPIGLKAKKPSSKAARIPTLQVEAGSGNVYADIGLPNPEMYQAKAHFVRAMRKIIKARRLTRINAAALLKIEPVQLSALLRGQTQRWSIEEFVGMINSLGHSIEISVSPSRPGRDRISVISVPILPPRQGG